MMATKGFLVKHHGNDYDISNFLKNHPGGFNYLESSRYKEIEVKMVNTNHSRSALYLMREYKIGGREKEITAHGDEDLEKLVDWDKPMLSQVGKLGVRYNEWVTSPVDRPLRLFGNQLLENLTVTPWYIVPVVWLPTTAYMFYSGCLRYKAITNDESSILPSISCMLFGMMMWTFLEYFLHRWVFHVEPSGSNKMLIYFHFIIHGLHHKAPFDTRRLVFPPVPAAILAYGVYRLIQIIFMPQFVLLILSGGIFGYVMYDMIHFYLHYGAPAEGTYLYNMKRYHNQHHFTHHDSGFGISSLCWDKLFGTAIRLKTLAIGIRWCKEKFESS